MCISMRGEIITDRWDAPALGNGASHSTRLEPAVYHLCRGDGHLHRFGYHGVGVKMKIQFRFELFCILLSV